MEIESNNDNPSLNREEVEEPKRGMTFSSKEEVYTFYAKYAKRVGFHIANRTQSIGYEGELKYFGIECSRAGRRKKKSEVNPLKPSLSTKIGCKAKVRASLQKDGRFMLTTIILEHNHDLFPTDFRHFISNKRLHTSMKRRLEVNDQVGIGVSSDFHSLVDEVEGYEQLTFDERDCDNYIERAKRLRRLGVGGANLIQDYFLRMKKQNSNFFYVMNFGDDGYVRNFFWADARSRVTYEAFGDVVTFDTTYLTNKYDLPLALFVGVNHHGQSILLGCGLLSSEDTNTYVWLFKSWLSCMLGHPPKAIITVVLCKMLYRLSFQKLGIDGAYGM